HIVQKLSDTPDRPGLLAALTAFSARNFALRPFTKTRSAGGNDWRFWIFCLSHNSVYCFRR
ncbi:MAG TPA: hypothetical protein VJS17_01270, partial [Pyrinomonadaceae bacterium]|nr:hypothetical protein [Pyrinomonadaceae bacterium]